MGLQGDYASQILGLTADFQRSSSILDKYLKTLFDWYFKFILFFYSRDGNRSTSGNEASVHSPRRLSLENCTPSSNVVDGVLDLRNTTKDCLRPADQDKVSYTRLVYFIIRYIIFKNIFEAKYQ